MPWNDNANPGPWGSPQPGDDGDRKDSPNAARKAAARAAPADLAATAPTWAPGWNSCGAA